VNDPDYASNIHMKELEASSQQPKWNRNNYQYSIEYWPHLSGDLQILMNMVAKDE
jgi:hypothetical protein